MSGAAEHPYPKSVLYPAMPGERGQLGADRSTASGLPCSPAVMGSCQHSEIRKLIMKSNTLCNSIRADNPRHLLAEMTSMVSKTIARIQSEGYDALVNALGPEDAIRFIRSFDPGSGDYTIERKKYLKKKTVKQIGKEILELQKSI